MSTTHAEPVLAITRLFDAPPSLVFRLWIEAEHIARWWGLRGYTTLSAKTDPRVGGAWRVVTRSPDGREHCAYGIYREIAPPDRLVFTHAWEGSEGGPPGHETLVTITFAAAGEKTRMTFHQAAFASTEARDRHDGGWGIAFDRIAEHLATL